MQPTAKELAYVAWQNRATRFYLAARQLHESGNLGPAAYCCHQATELLLKATLVYWDKSFNPRDAGHSLTKLCRMLRNKARGASHLELPAYFAHEKRFLSVSRYPTTGKGILIPSHTISDLDRLFVELIRLVPFQHNTELRRALSGRDRKRLTILRKRNMQMRTLRSSLRIAESIETSNV